MKGTWWEAGTNLFKRRVLRPDVLAALGFGLSLVYLYFRLGAATPPSLEDWISSDTLYPVNVTVDVGRDGFPLSGWWFSIAPFWIPDVFLTGVFWIVTRNPIEATLLTGFLQLVFLAGVMALIRSTVRTGDKALHNVLFFGMAVIVTLFVANHLGQYYPDLYRFYQPQSHVGSLIVSLAALGLAMDWARRSMEGRPASAAVIAAYVVLCLLGAMSNAFFLVQMLIPYTLMAGLLGAVGVIRIRDTRAAILAGWPAAVSGVVLNGALFHTTPVSAQSTISVASVTTAFDVFRHGFTEHLAAFEGLHILAVTWIAVCLIPIVITMRRVMSGDVPRLSAEMRMVSLFCGFSLLSGMASAVAIIGGGSNSLAVFKNYEWGVHYLQSIFYLPLLGLPLVLALAIRHLGTERLAGRLAVLLSLPTLVVPALLLGQTPRPKVSIANYRPPLVKYLDSQAALRGWRYGIGGYWQARITTLLSRRNLRVYPVDNSLHPRLWVSNQYWYTEQVGDGRKAPPIDFVILDGRAFRLSREEAVRVLGEPAEELRFEGTRILSYSGVAGIPSMASLAGDAGENEPLHEFREQITGSIKPLEVAAGGTASVPVTITNVSHERWASRGKYPVTLSYRWLKAGKDTGVEGLRTLLSIPLNPGQAEAVEARIAAPQEAGTFLLRLSLVQEGVAWFVLRGAKPLDIAVRVGPERQADGGAR